MTEVLLKQTRAETVATMIEGFFGTYPDPRTLSRANIELERRIASLGFGSQRARQLRALAKALLVAEPGVPTNWIDLPGIGPYSSGMVRAALGARGVVAVDTNIARVVGRLYGARPTHSEARKSTNIWQLAERLTRSSRSSIQVLWALLDLGALLCRTRSPDCKACPLRLECHYAITATRQGLEI